MMSLCIHFIGKLFPFTNGIQNSLILKMVPFPEIIVNHFRTFREIFPPGNVQEAVVVPFVMLRYIPKPCLFITDSSKSIYTGHSYAWATLSCKPAEILSSSSSTERTRFARAGFGISIPKKDIKALMQAVMMALEPARPRR